MAAAGAVASRHLRSAVQPRLIVAGADFVVALDPLPVIARVTSIAEDHQGRIPPALQVELARYAAHRDGPVVTPWPAGAGPFDIGEFVVTLWERAPNRPVSPESVGRALRRFHECIADFPGSLPSFDPRPMVRRIAADLPPTDHATAAVLLAGCDSASFRISPGNHCTVMRMPAMRSVVGPSLCGPTWNMRASVRSNGTWRARPTRRRCWAAGYRKPAPCFPPMATMQPVEAPCWRTWSVFTWRHRLQPRSWPARICGPSRTSAWSGCDADSASGGRSCRLRRSREAPIDTAGESGRSFQTRP